MPGPAPHERDRAVVRRQLLRFVERVDAYLAPATIVRDVFVFKDAATTEIDTRGVGMAVVALGGGRATVQARGGALLVFKLPAPAQAVAVGAGDRDRRGCRRAAIAAGPCGADGNQAAERRGPRRDPPATGRSRPWS